MASTPTRLSEILDEILPRLRVVSGPDRKGEFNAWCPFHPDGQGKPPHRANLRVSERGFICDACGAKGGLHKLAEHLGIPRSRISDWSDWRRESTSTMTIEHTYDYTDEGGNLLFQVVRRTGKQFTQRRPYAKGWRYDLDGVRRVLYRLPEIIARPDEVVYVVEGEKDADRLAREELLATTNPGGAGKWRPEYSEMLAGRDVIIIPDNDEPGERHAQHVAEELGGLAGNVQIARLPGLPPKGDVSDWLDAGGSMANGEWQMADGKPLSGSSAMCHQPSAIPAWPDPVSDAALHGLAGDIVRALEPHTEADPMAILTSLFAAYGNAIGRKAYFLAEADRHYMNLFTAHVGMTAKGRKGTSWNQVKNLFSFTDPGWMHDRNVSGMSSGEGLIWAVRDAEEKGNDEKGRKDAGISDKRLMVVEGEFAGTLRVLGREGNTLSAIIRNAWDTGSLVSLTKNSQAKATGAHISIIGHITRDELVRYLGSTEAGNGFANRFLWVCVRRSKVLPEGGRPDVSVLEPLIHRLGDAIRHGEKEIELSRDGDARALWHEVYPDLSEGKPGLLGAVTARAEAQVMRLACVYALLDLSSVVRKVHLEAALAVWRYSEDSARFIFGESLGDPLADEILRVLKESPEGVTRKGISDHFSRLKPAHELDRATGMLASAGLIRAEKVSTGGRPAVLWHAVRATDPGTSHELRTKSAAGVSSYFVPDSDENDDEWGEV